MSNRVNLNTYEKRQTYKSRAFLVAELFNNYACVDIEIPSVEEENGRVYPNDCGVNFEDDLSILQYLLENIESGADEKLDSIMEYVVNERKEICINGAYYEYNKIKDIIEEWANR